MKKYILSPLCSAFIVPGLGQVLNGQLKKGIVILVLVFIFIVGFTISLAFIIMPYVHQYGLSLNLQEGLARALSEKEITPLLFLFILLAFIWLYSVLDAFWIGIKKEKQAGDNGQ